MHSVKYIAEIENVREIGLQLEADADYWTAQLQPEGLIPYQVDGKTEIRLFATALSWMGLRFNELIAIVSTSSDKCGETCDGFYLVAAINTSRILAGMERTFFKTPYRHASMSFEPGLEPRVEVRRNGATSLHMQMAETDRKCTLDERPYEGPIDLPGRRTFFVKIAGPAEVCPFLPEIDRFDLSAATGFSIFDRLSESACTPREWRICRRATHARSKTYRRD